MTGADVDVLTDAAFLRHELDGALNATLIHHQGLAVVLVRWLAAGKEQGWVMVRCPIAAQSLQRQQRQRHEPVLIALAAANVDPHQVTVDIGDLKVQCLAEAQTSTNR